MVKTGIRLMLYAVLAGVIIMFVSLNKHISVVFLWPNQTAIETESWILFGSIFVIGLLCGATFFWLSSLRLQARIWTQNRKINKLQADADARHSASVLPPSTH